VAGTLAAGNNEDLPRLLKTMGQEKQNRDLFIPETQKGWDATDTYARLDGIRMLKSSNAPPPGRPRMLYAAVWVVKSTLQVVDRETDGLPTEWARRLTLTHNTSTFE